MDDRSLKIERNFRRFFWVALPIIFLMICLSAADVIFRLNLGYNSSHIGIASSIFLFGVVVRLTGLRIIRFFSDRS
jgi:hypothetical protein